MGAGGDDRSRAGSGSAAGTTASSDAHAALPSGNISSMGFLDRLLGRSAGPESRPRQHASASSPAAAGELTDEQALERYRYLVRTAPPEAIEQAHEEAFAKLTPEQRRTALRDLSAAVPEHERTGGDDPRSLARMATRAETNRPGTVERAFGGGGGMLGGMGGTLLGSFAAAFAGSLVAQSLFSEFGGERPRVTVVRREMRATRAGIPEATSAGAAAATSAAATSASETGTPVAPAGHPLFAAHGEPGLTNSHSDHERQFGGIIVDPTAPAPAYDGLLAGGYARGMPMHTEPGRACRRKDRVTLASVSNRRAVVVRHERWLVPSGRGRRGFEALAPGRTQAAAPIGEGSR